MNLSFTRLFIGRSQVASISAIRQWDKKMVLLFIFAILAFVYVIFYFRAPTVFRCNAGECAVNLTTGAKRCPAGVIDPSSEVCSIPSLCTSPEMPYAIQPDGSSDTMGKCSSNQCPCSKTIKCIPGITSTFAFQDIVVSQNNDTFFNPLIQEESTRCTISVDEAVNRYGSVSDIPCIVGSPTTFFYTQPSNPVSVGCFNGECASGSLFYNPLTKMSTCVT